MHLSVIYDYAHVAGIATRQRALLHALHDALEDGGHEASVDGAAHNAVDEDELATPLQVDNLLALGVDAVFLAAESVNFGSGHTLVVGLNDEVHLAELACTARLLLVAIVGTGCLGDGLAIGNLGLVERDLNLFVVLHAPLQGAQVELTLAVHEDLLQFLRLLNLPRGVFLAHLLQGVHHLLRLGLVDGADGA